MKMPDKKPSMRMSYLCAMMEIARANDLHWSTADMGAMLVHLLDAPLRTQLPEELTAETLGGLGTPLAHGCDATMRAALQDDAVPAEVLVAIKNYAKQAMDGSRDDLPAEVAKAVYVAVVARARRLRRQEVSSLSDGSFEAVARWCLAQNWVPPALRSVVRQGLEPYKEGLMSHRAGAKS